jgi:hypothetical protein
MQRISIGLLARRLLPALGIESARTAQPTNCVVHDPASRSGPAAEAASIYPPEQVNRLSRAW